MKRVAVVWSLFISCGNSPSPSAPTSITAYEPEGCAYSVEPPAARGYQNLRRDDGRSGGKPARVRIGLGGNGTQGSPGYPNLSTSAAFTWESPGNAAQVRLGRTPDALKEVHAGYSWSAPPPADGSVGGNDDPLEMHEVHVCGLTPATTYYYQVGGGDVWSPTESFTTVPSEGPITFGVSGDSRDSVDVFRLVQLRMRDAAVQFQLMSGDLVLFGKQASLYRGYLDAAAKDASGKTLTLGAQLFLPLAGNHEVESSQFYANFALPGEGDIAEKYFSFEIGNAHIVMFDDQGIATHPDTDDAKAGLAWLDADLARANQSRKTRPFIVVLEHRGLLSTSEHAKDDDVASARQRMMPLWDKHHVDLVLSGHDHDYERSKPARAGPVLAADGTTYVVCAGAGAAAYRPAQVDAPYRELSVGYGSGTPFVGNYALVTLETNKLAFKAYGLKTAGGSVAGDEVIDSFVLTAR